MTPRFALAMTGVLLFTGIFAIAGTEEEGFGVFSALLAWGSTIPMWWKARRQARTAAAAGGTDVQGQVDERLKAIEERLSAPIARIESGTQQLMEIEERMDFLERLLTRVRGDQARLE